MKNIDSKVKKIIVLILAASILAVWSATLYYAMKDGGSGGTADITEGTQTDVQESSEGEETSSQNEITSAETSETVDTAETSSEETTSTFTEATIDELREYRVNETGQIFILMFHGFIPDDQKDTYNDRKYTMTFSQFRETLQTLYDMDYRPVTMDEFLNGDFDVPLGKTPIVLTFDDGRSGQFNLMEKDGSMAVNPDSAVGIWIEFNETHPDFDLKGTFYVNLGTNTFLGSGTLKERMEVLIGLGFEIGSHGYVHAAFREMTTADEVIYEIGKNQEAMEKLVPGYKFTSLALPLGEDTLIEELKGYVVEGTYQDTGYFNVGVLDCKWRPSYSPFSVNFDSRSIYRVRADGLDPAECDMSDWMFNTFTSKRGQYISDGSADTVTVPESLLDDVDQGTLGDRKLITYILD